mmetsp:Transcript_22115/g.33486  ORF Transcript_22115/g.33486 Transcript_22115/m.33486 type:complete len:144 (-) Transcript_22115:606-1037(-)
MRVRLSLSQGTATTIIFSTTPSYFHLPSNFNELSLYIPHCCIVELNFACLKFPPTAFCAFLADRFCAFHFCTMMPNANSFYLSFICASFAAAFVSFLCWISCRSRRQGTHVDGTDVVVRVQGSDTFHAYSQSVILIPTAIINH